MFVVMVVRGLGTRDGGRIFLNVYVNGEWFMTNVVFNYCFSKLLNLWYRSFLLANLPWTPTGCNNALGFQVTLPLVQITLDLNWNELKTGHACMQTLDKWYRGAKASL